MKSKFFIITLVMVVALLCCSEEKSIRIAAIQMNCQLGETERFLYTTKIIQQVLKIAIIPAELMMVYLKHRLEI